MTTSNINSKPLLWTHLNQHCTAEQTLAEALASAVEYYKERVFKGLNNLCDDDIEAIIAEFVAKFEPVNGSDEQMANFLQLLSNFKRSLADVALAQQTESLLITTNQKRDENNSNPNHKIFPQHEFARLSHFRTAGELTKLT